MMTRKHYVQIAEAIREQKEWLFLRDRNYSNTDAWSALYQLEGQLARVLRDDNPRFDLERFVTACAVSEGLRGHGTGRSHKRKRC